MITKAAIISVILLASAGAKADTTVNCKLIDSVKLGVSDSLANTYDLQLKLSGDDANNFNLISSIVLTDRAGRVKTENLSKSGIPITLGTKLQFRTLDASQSSVMYSSETLMSAGSMHSFKGTIVMQEAPNNAGELLTAADYSCP